MKPKNVNCRKTLLGKYEVTYDCPGCGESLKNDLDDAGKNDHCPHCECEFVVPGLEYKREIERRRIERIEEKELKKRDTEEKAREQAEAKAKRDAELAAKEKMKEESLKSIHVQAINDEPYVFAFCKCGYRYRTKATNIGQLKQCPECKNEFTVPGQKEYEAFKLQNTRYAESLDNKTAIQYISEGMAELVRALFYSFLSGFFGMLAGFFGGIASTQSSDTVGIWAAAAIISAIVSFVYGIALFGLFPAAIRSFEKGSRS